MPFIPALGIDFTSLIAYSNHCKVVSVQNNREWDHFIETTTITGYRRRNSDDFKYSPECKVSKYKFGSEERKMEIDCTIDATIDTFVSNNLLRPLAAHLIYNEMLFSDCLWADMILSIALPRKCFEYVSLNNVRQNFFEGYKLRLESRRFNAAFPNCDKSIEGCEARVEAVDIVCLDDAIRAICGTNGKRIAIIADFDKTLVYSFKNGELCKEEELHGLIDFCDNVQEEALALYLSTGEKALEISCACDFFRSYLLKYIGNVGYIKPEHIHIWGTAADMIGDFGAGKGIPCTWHDANVVAKTCAEITMCRYPYKGRAGCLWNLYGGH